MRSNRIAVVLFVTVIILTVLTACNTKQASSLPSEQNSVSSRSQSQLQQLDDKNFSETEKDTMLKNMTTTYNYVEIFDYAFGDKDSVIRAAAVCKDTQTGNETVVLYTTDSGVGLLILADGLLEVKYNGEGIAIEGGNIITLTLHNSKTNETHDYKIDIIREGIDIYVNVNASLRE